MATYINEDTGREFDVRNLDAPGFLKEFLNYLLVIENLAPRAVFNYYVQIRIFLRWIKCRRDNVDETEIHTMQIFDLALEDIASIKMPDIYEYLAFCQTILKNEAVTRSLKLTAIKRMYKYFTVQSHQLDSNPSEQIITPKTEKLLPRYLTLDESRLLLDSVGKDFPERDYCMFLLLLTCGMRLSELVNMDVGDIREDTIRIYGKGRKERLAYLNDACVKALNEYLEARSLVEKLGDSNALWVSKHTGGRLTGRRVEQIVAEALSRAGLSGRGFSPHKLRHTAATLAYQYGDVGVLELKEILGHENIATTESYTHINSEQIKSSMAKSPLSGEKRKPE